MKPIVHIILNSHLDLSTARTACDLLDAYPEINLTRGEAWFYETVERHDPATFERLRGHIAAGRLHVVGGWYVQPDCNLASPETYRRHNEFGGAYFRENSASKSGPATMWTASATALSCRTSTAKPGSSTIA